MSLQYGIECTLTRFADGTLKGRTAIQTGFDNLEEWQESHEIPNQKC